MNTAARARREDAPAADQIQGYVDALLEHPSFPASPRRKRLLAYLVKQTLTGRADRLKAFDIAVAVLGCDERFDPQQNPIVRLDVSRLRRDLQHYYLTAGGADAIRIDIPKGGYVPTFAVAPTMSAPAAMAAANAAPAAPARAMPRGVRALLALLLVLTAVVSLVALRPATKAGPEMQQRGPSLVVMPFQALAGGEAAVLLASGLTNQLVADLMRVQDLRVYAGAAPPGAPAPLLPTVAFRAEGAVQRDQTIIRVDARLVDAGTNEVLWSESVDRPASVASVLELQDEIATRIAERLALPNGAIAVATERPAATRPATMFAYDCVQRAWLYRRKSVGTDRSDVLGCLDEALRLEPGYASAWALESFVRMDGARLGLVPQEQVAGELTASRAAAERAYVLAPNAIVSLQALAGVRYNDGAFAEAERLQREAIALSPHNPESLAQLGWRLAARGRLDEAVGLLREAIDRSWQSPTWYHQTLALTYFLRGETQPAYDEAILGQGFCCGLGNATLAITAASLGRTEEARAALGRALAQAPRVGSDPRGFWRVFHIEEALIDRLVMGLRQAGLDDAAA